MEPILRKETPRDYRAVETMTRNAFYNIYVPGCIEHYLVHTMRSHEDFIPELDFVLELDGQVIGNIMYTRAALLDEHGGRKEILTFGPLCIAPAYQRSGYGKRLMEYSFAQAVSMGYDAIVIFGDPANYISSGFRSCKKYGVCTEDGRYPSAMLVKELQPGAFSGKKWRYRGSAALEIDEAAAQQYDETLEPKIKCHQPSQETFYILSQSFLPDD